MKLLVDTNIFLDVLLQRENVQSSVIVLNSVKEGLFEGVVADITILNIDYIAKKQAKNIKEFLSLIACYFTVVGADNAMMSEVLNMQNDDLEDSFQYACAKKAKCKAIITNDNGFCKGDIKIHSSNDFVKEFI